MPMFFLVPQYNIVCLCLSYNLDVRPYDNRRISRRDLLARSVEPMHIVNNNENINLSVIRKGPRQEVISPFFSRLLVAYGFHHAYFDRCNWTFIRNTRHSKHRSIYTTKHKRTKPGQFTKKCDKHT